jgi:type IV pilus biogenesis protein CpaD/CtpE
VNFPTQRTSNADSPWLGCVSDANLRAMLDDPSDLERGRPLGPADGDRESLGVEDYKAGKTKGGQGASAAPAIGSAGTP